MQLWWINAEAGNSQVLSQLLSYGWGIPESSDSAGRPLPLTLARRVYHPPTRTGNVMAALNWRDLVAT